MAAANSQTQIYLAKRQKVILPTGHGTAAPQTVATAAKNLHALGFGLSDAVLNGLRLLSDSQIAYWYESVLPVLQEMVGAHRHFKPMYPNFPRQVMEASDAELYFNAITHYFGFHLSDALGDPNLVVLPNYQAEPRLSLDEYHNLRWIDLGGWEDFDSIFTTLLASNGAISSSDKDVIRWFIANRDVRSLLPAQIPQKETLAFLIAELPDKDCLRSSIKTATDVLRVAVAMSGGDVSLAEATKFRCFSKRERRFLLSCLEQHGNSLVEDMLRWKERWVRLGERLHPGDFKRRFPGTLQAFDTLRNGLPYETFNSRVEQLIVEGDTKAIVELLTQRPGEFARRLDHVLRTCPDPLWVLTAFCQIAHKVSTPVLLQAWGHFHKRDIASSRAFFPKGNAAKVQFTNTSQAPLVPTGTARVAADRIHQVLITRFAKLPRLGKCYIDARLKQQFVPFSQRSASRSLRTVARGSSFELPAGNTIRFFCWWKNIESSEEGRSRVDIDLSASLFNQQWEHVEDIAYYQLRSGDCYHSGDITSAPEGACEFIDINLKSTWFTKARYIVISVLCFTRQPFTSMPECFCGWMMRQRPNSGEIFEPQTVSDKVDLTASTPSCVPVIIDAANRIVYWTDIGLKSRSQINNAARNSVGFSQIGRAIVELRKPTLYELFDMHVEGRGERVSQPTQADTIFGLQEGTVTAFDLDLIRSQFMS